MTKKKANKLYIIIFLVMLSPLVMGQYGGYGGALIYNFDNNGVGLDLRAEYPIEQIDLLDGVSLVPQLSYFPWFNDRHELFLGSSIHLGVYSYKKWQFYTLANLSYNMWFNHADSNEQDAHFSNGSFELGVGISYAGCLKPFIEYRHKPAWKDNTIRAGVVYFFNCEKRGMVPCSKVPPPPSF